MNIIEEMTIRHFKSRETFKVLYKEYIKRTNENIKQDAFIKRVQTCWNKIKTTEELTENGELKGLLMNASTVQVDGEGKVIQAWIKSKREEDVELEELLETIKGLTPYNIKVPKKIECGSMLEIPIFDMHFGICDYKHYERCQLVIAEKIKSKQWDLIVFPIGSDLFHNNDLKGNTANGTPIERVNMAKAYKDAYKFYEPLLRLALENSNKVKGIYIPGNHSEMPEQDFCIMLEILFPQIDWDNEFEYRKVVVYHKIFLGLSHGDKGKSKPQNISGIYTNLFPKEFARTMTREVHDGHLHTEIDCEAYGFMHRHMGTANITDEWHKTEGYVGNHKRFKMFEFSKKHLEAIYYIN